MHEKLAELIFKVTSLDRLEIDALTLSLLLQELSPARVAIVHDDDVTAFLTKVGHGHFTYL